MALKIFFISLSALKPFYLSLRTIRTALKHPRTKADSPARKQATLDQSQQQPTHQQPGVILHDSRQRGNDPPRDGDEGDPPRRPDIAFDDQIRREFGREVSGEEHRDGDRVLVAAEIEVFFQAVEAGVADVDSASVSDEGLTW